MGKKLNFILLILLCSKSALADQYDIAFEHIKQAFIIQSGLQTHINHFGDYATSKATIVVDAIGIEDEIGVAFFGYKIYRDQSFSFPIAHNKRLTLMTDRILLTIGF